MGSHQAGMQPFNLGLEAKLLLFMDTPQKTQKMDPKNEGLEDAFPFNDGIFLVIRMIQATL